MNFRVMFVFLMPLLLSLACAESSPPPLMDLVEAADLVVVADVTAVTDAADSRMPARTDRVAHLAVRETWKGQPVAALEVPFNDFARWPAPPAYVAGTRVVALLRREGGAWGTVGMSAGVIAAGGGEDLATLRARMAKALGDGERHSTECGGPAAAPGLP